MLRMKVPIVFFIGLIMVKSACAMQISEGFVVVPGGKVFYKKILTDSAADKTPLVCVNGGPGLSHDHFIDLACALANDRPVVLYDQLGCGKSVVNAADEIVWELPRFVEELTYLLEHLGYSEWYVLGHSWGGAIATQYAVKHQEKVCALILSSPLIGTFEWEQDARELLKTMPDAIQKTIADHEAAGTMDSLEFQEAAQKFQDTFLWHGGSKPLFAGTFNTKLYLTMWGPYEFCATGTLKNLSLWDDLADLSLPILFCYGRFDWILPRTADSVMNAQKVVFEKSAHLSFLEEPELYAQTMRQFLDGCDDGVKRIFKDNA